MAEIEYLEVVGLNNKLHTKITDTDDIKRIILLIQQLNGPAELEYIPSDEPLVGLSITLKGHYPSSAILIYKDKSQTKVWEYTDKARTLLNQRFVLFRMNNGYAEF